MGDSKVNYEISRALMTTLPPIKEESFLSRLSSSGGSPRHVKQVFADSKHAIFVQTLPPDPYSNPPTPVFEPEPAEDTLELEVGHVVSDYLHYARYSAAVPVKPDDWNPDETLYCSCCSDRNDENIRRQQGLPSTTHNRQPVIRNVVGGAVDGPLVADSVGKGPSTVSPKPLQTSHIPATITDPSWTTYQSLPYSKLYLKPEFNRPAYIEGYAETMKGDDKRSAIKAEVLESNHKLNEAMNKLRHTAQRLDPDYEEPSWSFS